MANFGDIREILQQEPSQKTWDQLAEGLQHWYGTEPMQSVLEYCASHVSHWPADLPTFAPRAWFKRKPTQFKKSPITTFFVHCFAERTTYFVEEARAELAGHKTLKPPKFVDLDALGTLRWRSGEAFEEDDRKRFIAMLRQNDTELRDTRLERLRQLLDDDDCQRWSKKLHEQWRADGEKSAHKWALFQIAYLGIESDIMFTTSDLTSMVSSGKGTRASQYLDIKSSFESREAMASVASFVIEAPTYYATRQHAVTLLTAAARAKKTRPRAFVAHHTSYFEPLFARLDGASGEELGEAFEEAMLRQAEVPAWRLTQGLFADETRREDLATVIFAVARKRFRVTAEGPVTLTGKPFELLDKAFVHVAHPAEIPEKERARWSALFEKESRTPLCDQLSRTVFTHELPVIPARGAEVHDTWFYDRAGFRAGREEGNGYTSTLVCTPPHMDWYVTLDINYFIRVGYGYAEEHGQELPRIMSMDVHSKYDSASVNDPVVYSEASLITHEAVLVAQREPED